MHELLHIIEHAAEDTFGLIPFLFLTYLVLEVLERAAGERVNTAVRRAGTAGPVVGAVLGVVPQCGFSAMAATLYAGRVITVGTLVAVFMSTSDEMLPLLVAERIPFGRVAGILALKAVLALATGVIIDLAVRTLRRRHHHVPEDPAHLIDELSDAGAGTDGIHRLCEQDRCGCEEQHSEVSSACCGHSHNHDHQGSWWSVIRSAAIHTIQVTIFIYVVTLVLVAILETVGEPVLEQLLSQNVALATVLAALVGLIPNCAASIVITQLYLEGVLTLAPMIAGTLASAGVGYLVLFRTNRAARQNLLLLALVFGASVAWGFILYLFGL